MTSKNLRFIQIGLETTSGTEVNATAIWGGTGTLEDAMNLQFVDEDVGYLPDTDRTTISYYEGRLTMEDTPATYEQLPFILTCGVKADTDGSADGSGSGKIYTYTFPTTTANTIDSATIECGDGQQEEQMLYCFVPHFRLSGRSRESVMVSADWIGRQVATGTKTGSLSPSTLNEIQFGHCSFTVDTAGGTFGGTAKSNTLLAFEFDMITGWIPKHTAEGQLYFSFPSQVGPDVTLTVTMEHNATCTAEVAAWRAETARLLRVKATGPALTTSGTAYSNYTMIIDVAGKWLNWEKLGDIDGNDIRVGTFKGRYNSTASDFGKIIVVNQTATI